jgi:hypothetical protein
MKKYRGLLKQGSQSISTVDGAKAYAELREQITKAGILDRDYRYYTILTLSLFAGYFFQCLFHVQSRNNFSNYSLWSSLCFFYRSVSGHHS